MSVAASTWTLTWIFSSLDSFLTPRVSMLSASPELQVGVSSRPADKMDRIMDCGLTETWFYSNLLISALSVFGYGINLSAVISLGVLATLKVWKVYLLVAFQKQKKNNNFCFVWSKKVTWLLALCNPVRQLDSWDFKCEISVGPSRKLSAWVVFSCWWMSVALQLTMNFVVD